MKSKVTSRGASVSAVLVVIGFSFDAHGEVVEFFGCRK